MIGEKERYHGVALWRLVRDGKVGFRLRMMDEYSPNAYQVNDGGALYLKYSTKRLSPWPFFFTDAQFETNEELVENGYRLWLVFVCGPVGVVSVEWERALQTVIRPAQAGGFSLTISRRSGEKFRIAGGREEPILASENAFPKEIVEAIPLITTEDGSAHKRLMGTKVLRTPTPARRVTEG